MDVGDGVAEGIPVGFELVLVSLLSYRWLPTETEVSLGPMLCLAEANRERPTRIMRRGGRIFPLALPRPEIIVTV